MPTTTPADRVASAPVGASDDLDGIAGTVLRLGVVGAGGFALFVDQAIRTLPQLHVVAVTDRDPARARDFAEPHGARVHASTDDLLADPEVDAVLLATPPAQHAELSLTALAAGKHVFCEKPAALDPEQAAQVAQQVQATSLGYVVDHVIHYNPLVQLLHRLQRQGVLGQVQRFSFDNDAGDSELPPGHWFWDPRVSGGILLEHGVHFFDVARLLLGRRELEVQTRTRQRDDGRVDTVVSTVVHEGGALATHCHGFSHANPTERQLMRIDFGLGEARLEGWIPLELRLDAWLDEPGLELLRAELEREDCLTLPGFRANPHQAVQLQLDGAPAQQLRTLDQDHPDRRRVRLVARLGRPQDKLAIYQESVRAALTDFLAASAGARPLAGIAEGAAAVAVAHAATLAGDGSVQPVTPTGVPLA